MHNNQIVKEIENQPKLTKKLSVKINHVEFFSLSINAYNEFLNSFSYKFKKNNFYISIILKNSLF